jgi:hypothetical protein
MRREALNMMEAAANEKHTPAVTSLDEGLS